MKRSASNDLVEYYTARRAKSLGVIRGILIGTAAFILTILSGVLVRAGLGLLRLSKRINIVVMRWVGINGEALQRIADALSREYPGDKGE